MREVIKYLVQWKGFTAEHNSCEKKEDLENAKEVVAEFEGRMNVEVRRQEKLDAIEEKDFRRGELPEKYMARMLYGWNDGKFENEYLRKLERNWAKWKGKNKTVWGGISSSGSRNLEGEVMSEL